ncbi:hypothetical protein [Mycobacterium riyadhense]
MIERRAAVPVMISAPNAIASAEFSNTRPMPPRRLATIGVSGTRQEYLVGMHLG